MEFITPSSPEMENTLFLCSSWSSLGGGKVSLQNKGWDGVSFEVLSNPKPFCASCWSSQQLQALGIMKEYSKIFLEQEESESNGSDLHCTFTESWKNIYVVL